MIPLFTGSIGMQEILLITLVVLLFFGGKKIPELMKCQVLFNTAHIGNLFQVRI